ncbi:sigma-54-dependent Fis family transcriptional regulator [Solimonas variicoloris]|uniref:sigma-54-dependent Fis family transcriptional regulator n=1 Tax=Solimonas variicoloris TaxID=254408 RepID=UPI00037C9A41|nr:sigma-54-dependent Fis family transcriptional regulator [Solimonas variicoloris]
MPLIDFELDRRIERARHLFLEGGEIPDHLIDDSVARSWQRSRGYGLRTGDKVIFNVVTHAERRRVEEANRALVGYAEPELQRLYAALSSADWVVACLNGSGKVVRAYGDDRPACREIGMAFRTGVDLGEDAAGTTGPSCALIEARPIVISGQEHFLDEARIFSCAAVPIFDPAGAVIGALDASRRYDGQRLGILEPLALAARAIENRMVLGLVESVRIAVHYAPELVATPMRGLLAFSADGELLGANPFARQLLELESGARPDFQRLFGRPFAALVDALRRAGEAPLAIEAGNGLRVYARLDGAPAPRPAAVRSASAAPRADAGPEALMATAQRAFNREVPILIGGETGTGKEVLARRLHANGPRRDGPFVAVNCSAIPAGLIESELFGYEAGAFTGARRGGMAGKFEQAHGGTLFLDEIGDMPLELQARLLRVLQERELTRLGGGRPLALDFSLVCASHRDLAALIARQQFRSDLYYRINGFRVCLPPLRERTDVAELIEQLLAEEAAPQAPPRLDAAARAALLRHAWPGNIRELRQALRLGVALAEDGVIGVDQLPAEIVAAAPSPAAAGLLERAEAEAVRGAMQRHAGNVSAAARSLGVARATLYRKLRQFGLLDLDWTRRAH